MIKLSKILIEFNGKIASVAEHCRDLGIKFNTVQSRHARTGKSYEECLAYYQKYGLRYKKYKVKDKRLYSKWRNTMDKCYNPKNKSYYVYGGRKPHPIGVCKRWHTYKNFEEDLLESFLDHIEKYGIKETTIDRYPNKLGDYEPSNVRWATYKEQTNNMTTNRIIKDGLTVSQFAEKYNLPYEVTRQRLNAGWPLDRIINTPISLQNCGKSKYFLPCNNPLRQYCITNNYSYEAVYKYIYKYGLEPHKALARYLKNNLDIIQHN